MDLVFEKWKEKLLDAGKGNRLLNYKDSQRRTLDILAPDLKTVFDNISDGDTLSFYDVDEYISKKKDNILVLNNEAQKSENKFDNFTKKQIFELLSDKLKKSQVLSFKKGATLQRTLKYIKKLSNDYILEKGINTLYMAFGFLRWTENENSKIYYSAPLVLIPIKIENDLGKNFTLSQYEDEVETNPTLIYFLKYNFDIILPEFGQEGYEEESITDYLERVQQQAQKRDWQVTDDVAIGTFSFLKMNMYKDFQENEEVILANQNIKKILNRQDQNLSQENEIVDIDKYFKEGKELGLHNVVDADSSQMEAIIQAQNGNSFVLQGPPGTGKSQTITNLIAEFLYNDKKVLFVSEKVEALNVVYNNLKRVGLEDFCLELHSYKTNKKEFINELSRVLNKNKSTVNSNANEEVEELKKSKKQLDEYANALHTVVPVVERTPFEVLGAISKYRTAPALEYAFSNLEQKGIEYFKQAVNTLESFIKYKEIIGSDYHKNAWYGYNDFEISYQTKIQLKNELSNAIEYNAFMEEETKKVGDIIGLNLSSCVEIKNNWNLLNHIANLKFVDNNIFCRQKLEILLKAVKIYNKLCENLTSLKGLVLKFFDEEFLKLNLFDYSQKFKNEYASFFRFLNKNYKKDKLTLLGYLKTNKKKMPYSELSSYIKTGNEIQNAQKQLEENRNIICSVLSKDFDFNLVCDWKEVETQLSKLESLLNEDLTVFKNANREQILQMQQQIKDFINVYNSKNDMQLNMESLQKSFDTRVADFNNYNFSQLAKMFIACQNQFESLENWIRFSFILNELKDLELKSFVDSAIKNNVSVDTLDKSFKLMYYSQWIYLIFNQNPTLQKFSRLNQDEAVLVFKQKDKLKFEIAKAEIVSKLSAKRPSLSNITAGSQPSIILREAGKKRKQKPVRQLLQVATQVIQTIKPCFLMSPLSVSTYLSQDSCQFDVVIFDEASQIFPWDAIGSIYRAKQVIVVGDSKQMPPSNYFNAELSDDDYDEETEDDSLDFESILDLCASVFNQQKLKWHYRSKTEDLITFSNQNFYDGELITFPSAIKDNKDTGVDFYFVPNGIFDRKTKTNIEEAKKVVDLVFEHFENNPERSLGVVAFSISQQEIIDELIQQRREKNDKFAKLFDTKKNEPFFVKNLETVQGDERDTIIFSVAYAKDINGKFIHNFGPLNKKGGERRLNVAITRAKLNVKLVSSIKTFDIDLNKTQAKGAVLLKEYLNCAEQGMQNVYKNLIADKTKQTESYFENEVFEFLTQSGYKVDTQVGCSGYRIDLAIKHPTNPDYVLAVECDGATYHQGRTTRDRDRLRQEVLERLGWKFYRIWSTDWFVNKQTEKAKLLKEVEKAIQNLDRRQEIQKEVKSKEQPKLSNEKKENTTFIVEQKCETKDLKSQFKVYEEYDIYKDYYKTGKPVDFNKIIVPLISTEQPITEDLLLKKTVGLFGNEKVTTAVKRSFYLQMQKHSEIVKVRNYYIVDRDKKIEMRIPKIGGMPRDIMNIANIELIDGIKKIIGFNVGITKEGLFKAIASLLGFKKIGENIKNKLESSLTELMYAGVVKEIEGELFLS